MNIPGDWAKLLARVELQANVPTSALAKQLEWKEHKVRRILLRMKEQNLIVERPFLNPQKLGVYEQAVFFSMTSRYPGARKQLLTTLAQSPKVHWLGTFSGQFDVGMTVATDNPFETFDMLEELGEEFCLALYNKSFASRVAIHFFGRRYLDPDWVQERALGYDGRTDSQNVQTALDETDYSILTGLSVRQYNSHRQLAKMLRIPLSTFKYRVDKLKSLGVLKSFFYVVDSFRIGMQSYKLLIRSRACSKELRDSFENYVGRHPHMVTLIKSIGHWDYEVGVEIKKNVNIARVTQELIDAFPDFLGDVRALPLLNVEEQIK